MKYLDCIELLDLALQFLKSGRRDQVPISRLAEVHMLVTDCMRRVTDLPFVTVRCSDLLMSIDAASKNKDVRYLPQAAKDVLVNGVQGCLDQICEEAWEYYLTRDVVISEETIPLLRTVVSHHYIKEV